MACLLHPWPTLAWSSSLASYVTRTHGAVMMFGLGGTRSNRCARSLSVACLSTSDDALELISELSTQDVLDGHAVLLVVDRNWRN